jgi:hypothetical protein
VVIPPSGYEPLPGDASLTRDQVFIDLENSQIVTSPSEPTQVQAILQGNLSDPCHNLRVVVTPPDLQNTLFLEVYSLVDPDTACITVIEPFTATIPLGSYPSGQYTVMVNGILLGEFGPLYIPQPGDDQLTRAGVSVDLSGSQLLTNATQPVQLSIILRGDLPDPCHQLRVVVNSPDENNSIHLEAYSLADKSIICITVIKPFEVTIPLGSFPSGQYTVDVNGQLLGVFDG